MRGRCVSAVLTLAVLAGCGLQDSRTPVRLAHWGGAGGDSSFDRLVKEIQTRFESENPDLRLRIEGIPGSQEYVTKMLLSFVAGTAPDVMTLDASSAAVFINNGVLLDLRPFIERDQGFRLEDYWPNTLEFATREKAIYAIPVDFTPMVMYYNRRLFREAGLPEPKPGWNYEDFRRVARELTKKDQYGFDFSNWMPGWITWLWNNGGDVLDPVTQRATGTLDSDSNVAAIEFLEQLISGDKSAPSLSESAGLGVALFAQGKAAMKISGHWELVGLLDPHASKIAPEDIGVVELPTQLPRSVTVMYQSGLSIGKNCRNPEAAWRYIKYQTSEAVQRLYNSSGIAVCARRDVAEARATTPLEKTFLRIIPSARRAWGADVEGYAVVEDLGQKMMDRILRQGRPVREALRETAREIDRELARMAD